MGAVGKVVRDHPGRRDAGKVSERYAGRAFENRGPCHKSKAPIARSGPFSCASYVCFGRAGVRPLSLLRGRVAPVLGVCSPPRLVGARARRDHTLHGTFPLGHARPLLSVGVTSHGGIRSPRLGWAWQWEALPNYGSNTMRNQMPISPIRPQGTRLA